MRDQADAIYPFAGLWRVQNSPADRVPSHGTRLFATAYAIDFLPVTARGRTAPVGARTLFAPEPPERFPGFGRPILAPSAGRVIAVHDGEPDHHAYRGLPSLRYAATQRARVAEGWTALAGNHVLIEAREGVVVALCHLRRGSISVARGAVVAPGDHLAECGNSGNSTEPHLHVQAMSGADPASAHAVPMRFDGGLPRNGTIVDGGAPPAAEPARTPARTWTAWADPRVCTGPPRPASAVSSPVGRVVGGRRPGPRRPRGA